MQYPLVSVIILNYNGRRILGKILENCLQSVLETDYPAFEVIFVDNASTDDSVRHIQQLFGQNQKMRIIVNAKNYGFAEGNNIGIRNSKGKYIALLNSDTRVHPNWLKELVNVIDHEKIGAVQSKLLRMGAPDFLDCAGGFVDYYGYHFERGHGEKASNYNQPSEVFYAKGAGMLLKNDVLRKTGFFDADTFLYFDEVDLCWRIWLSGYKVAYAPKSVVYHALASTTSELQTKMRVYFYTRNHLMILLKNYSLANLFKAVAVSILFETRNIFLFLARRKPQVSAARIQALLWNLFNFDRIWQKRGFVQKYVRIISDQEVRRIMMKPCPPFPLYLVFSRYKFLKRKK